MTDDGSSAQIPVRSANDAPADLARSLDTAGCLVITDMADEARRQRVMRELKPHMAATSVAKRDDVEDFYPGNTRRITALVARSETSRDLVQNQLINELCEHHLGQNCERHQLQVTAALEVGPGAREQILHREEDLYPFFEVPRPNLVLATMWAITDFTAENGGTLLVPGSHRWDADRVAGPDEIVAAEMSAGSVLAWLGGTLHGAGANVTDNWRYGVILTYSVGWIRQEENQYLDIPPHVAGTLSPELLALTGHAMHGNIGFHDPSVT
jgi:ectoine hydroxylase-related dioxygenase (phytanoyl-CoA dioxygenase family)